MPEDAKPKHDMDERVSIPLVPEEALRGLLAVAPDSEPVDGKKPKPTPKSAQDIYGETWIDQS